MRYRRAGPVRSARFAASPSRSCRSSAGRLASAVSGRSLYHRRKMIPFVTPHRPYHGDVIDDAADVREPVGDWNARLAIPGKRAQAWDHRPLHPGEIVSKPDRIDQFAFPLFVFRVEGVDVAHASAHKKKDDGFGLRLEMRSDANIENLSIFRPQSAHGGAEESAAGLIDKAASRDSAARIDVRMVHFVFTARTRTRPG